MVILFNIANNINTMKTEFTRNRQNILKVIKETAVNIGRNPADIRLMAVTKTYPESTINMAIENGITLFGENRVKEAADKYETKLDKVELHLIGHLQRNKAKIAAKVFSWVQSIDKIETARELNKYAISNGKNINILIQVNTSGEEAKSGIHKFKEINKLIEELTKLDCLIIRGLMTIGPFTCDEKEIRNSFKKLKELYDTIKNDYDNLPIDTLSMGMSSDFKIAIEEGATLIRIGSGLFGKRGVV